MIVSRKINSINAAQTLYKSRIWSKRKQSDPETYSLTTSSLTYEKEEVNVTKNFVEWLELEPTKANAEGVCGVNTVLDQHWSFYIAL